MSYTEASNRVGPTKSLRVSWLDGQLSTALWLPFLGLATPFISYVTDRSYPLMNLEVWLILAGMLLASFLIAFLRQGGRSAWYRAIVAAVFTFTVDYQFEWMKQVDKYIVLSIALSIFGTMLVLVWRLERTFTLVASGFLCVFVGTMVVGAAVREGPRTQVSTEPSITSSSAPPRLIHFVLDEHLGIEGIPDETEQARVVKRKLKQFYQHYGFALYGGAYSRYFHTHNSIPNLVNFSAESKDRAFILGDRPPYIVRQNQYFKLLKDHGYQLHIVGGEFLDFCSGQEGPPMDCTEYHWYRLDNVGSLNEPMLSKMSMLLATFLTKYHLYQRVLLYYESPMRPFLLSHGLAVPVINPESLWTKRGVYLFSVNTMVAMDAVSKGVLQLPRGHMLFAHLLLPHFPYVFREDCSPRAIADSMDNMETTPQEFRTSEGRALRYDQYLRQVECLYVILDDLFKKMQSAGLFDDTIIILHGDHGSRIGLNNPAIAEGRKLTDVDYADAFSTLFAVRIPGEPGSYDSSLRAIDDLLVATLGASMGSTPVISVPRRDPFVYMHARDQKELMPVQLPWKPPSALNASTVEE
jgi:hypothetical protein